MLVFELEEGRIGYEGVFFLPGDWHFEKMMRLYGSLDFGRDVDGGD